MGDKLVLWSKLQDAAGLTVELFDTNGVSAGSFTATYTNVTWGGRYTGAMPTLGAGSYYYSARTATTNDLVSMGTIAWDGSKMMEPTAKTSEAVFTFEALYDTGVLRRTFSSGNATTVSTTGLRAGSLIDTVLVITSGPLAGQSRDIAANTATDITLAQPFSEDPIAVSGGSFEGVILGRIKG